MSSSLDCCFWWIFYLIYHIFQLPTFNCCYAVTKSFPTLWSHGLQHARFPCPSLSPYFCANSSPLSWSCYPTITSSVTPFYSCPQSFPASGFFQWVGSSHQVGKVLELQIKHQSFQWIFRVNFLKGWLVRYPCSPRSLKSLLQHQNSKASILWCSAFFMVQLSSPYITTGKIIALTIWTFVSKLMSLLFNTPFKFVIAFLLRSKHLLISWLHSPSARK